MPKNHQRLHSQPKPRELEHFEPKNKNYNFKKGCASELGELPEFSNQILLQQEVAQVNEVNFDLDDPDDLNQSLQVDLKVLPN